MREYLDVMPRSVKRLIMLAADVAVIGVALWAAFALRLGNPAPALFDYWWLFLLMPALSVPVFAALGFYRMVVRYMGPHAVFALLKGVTLSTLVFAAIALVAQFPGFPRAVLPLYWLLAMLGIGGSRFLVRAYLQWSSRRMADKKPVIIYGAGNAGARLAAVLSAGHEYHPVAMIDDDRSLHGSVIGGVWVHSPKYLGDLIEEYDVNHVLLALPAVARSRRKAILQRLETYPVHVKTIPGLMDLVAGAKLDEIREVEVEDLLGRDPVAPDDQLMNACIKGKSVLVTGAAGSIGSELCRQIVRAGPKRLVLFEMSEFGLYRIERELQVIIDQDESDVELVPLLGTVTDRERLYMTMQAFSIETVYHAAAYKHVPIVEHNLIEGVRNNTLGTWHTAEAARRAGVETFVLISTDKAVRPTNVMGASKRMAEMVLQAMAEQGGNTTFCMVRFGNVLGSSGSVVPVFRQQIRRGGPVTVTHPEITRYFMTIPEAASLVIQAGGMAHGGDVFVLEMGEPVRIVGLAKEMIRLMGYQVRSEHRPDGDIEIQFTGLRPGEKLYEELLIGDNVTGTKHPKIHRAQEQLLSWNETADMLHQVTMAVRRADCVQMRALLREYVAGYDTRDEATDLLWNRRTLHGEVSTAELAEIATLRAGGDNTVTPLIPRH